jgi:DNA-binding transcriptional MocR family regulator
VPTFGNPGGKTLSDDRRRRLVELAKQHDVVIIEDDPYGEISFTDEVQRPLYQHAVELGCEDQWSIPRPSPKFWRRACVLAGS